MTKRAEDRLIAFLFAVVCIQAYVVLFKNPAAMVKGPPEPTVYTQHVPGSGEGRSGESSSLYRAPENEAPAPGMAVPVPAPAVGVAANPPPNVGGSPQPGVPPPGVNPTVVTPPQPKPGPRGPYQQLLMGIGMLEKDAALRLTPAQARALQSIIQQAEGAKDAVPLAQRTILATLNSAQKDFIREQARQRAAGGQRPPPPAGLDALIEKVVAGLGRR